MKTATTRAELSAQLRDWRTHGARVALVPTMGNLHAGHLRLVEAARKQADKIVVSIFVNPSQFGPNEDFAAYPRTPEADAAKLDAAGADLLFQPEAGEIYPGGSAGKTQVEVPGLSDDLCGKFRPGHFRGVATVVLKLFNLVCPDVALFGEKDYQQLTVIRRMVADLDLTVAIHGVATEREASGLAMSSRNGYLSASEREQAAGLYAELQAVAASLRAGRRDLRTLEQSAAEALASRGFRVDYVAIRKPDDLGIPEPHDQDWIVLAAAHLGRTRLIDNLRVSLA